MASISKTQIDRLGDRLKKGSHSETDLRMLDDYRRSFGEAYEAVLERIRLRSQLPTGRISKSTNSIVEKLKRESIRLSQIQDIAGCRVVVASILEEDQFVGELKSDFPQAIVMDRRENPSHGYRAVHVIVTIIGKPVEVQVRTRFQHLWAEFSEKASDVHDSKIKYGGGPEKWQDILSEVSDMIASLEALEIRQKDAETDLGRVNLLFQKAEESVAQFKATNPPNEKLREVLQGLAKARKLFKMNLQKQQEQRGEMAKLWHGLEKSLVGVIKRLDRKKEPGL